MWKLAQITLICWGLLLGLAAGGFGQNKEVRKAEKLIKEENREQKKALTTRFLVFDYGANWGTLRDTRMSTVRYAGPGAGLAVGYWRDQPRHNWRFNFLGAQYQSLIQDQSLVHGVRLEAEAAYTRQVASILHGAMDVRVGGVVNNFAYIRFHPTLSNTAFHFDNALSLAPTVLLVSELPLGNRPLRFEYQLTVPLTGYYFHWPEYLLSGWGTGSGTILYPGRYERMKSQFRFQRPLGRSGTNRMQLSYTWDYYRFNDPSGFRVQSAVHSVAFSLLFHL